MEKNSTTRYHYCITIGNQNDLTNFIEKLNSNDFSTEEKLEIIIDYEGELTLPNSLIFNHQDIEIRGKGKELTTICVNDKFDFTDDCIIGVMGNPSHNGGKEHPVAVKITDLAIKSEVNRCIYEQQDKPTKFVQGCFAIKIYCASKVEFHSIKIHVEDIACTNVDIRKGENINISDCEFINYNRQMMGGVIWLRGDIKNANVRNNVIRKYGNDEAIGIWSVNNYIGISDGATEIRKEHIHINGNEFYNEIVPYIPNTEIETIDDFTPDENMPSIDLPDRIDTGIIGDWDGAIDRYLVIFTNQDDNLVKTQDGTSIVLSKTPVRHIVKDVHVNGNTFHMNAPVKITASFVFDTYTEYEDISFNDNLMIYSNWQNGTFDTKSFYGPMDVSVLYDVCYGEGNELDAINAYSGLCNSPVEVCRNIFKSNCHVNVYEDNEFHSCLNMEGTNVIFNDNTIEYTYKSNYNYPLDFAKAGYIMLYGSSKSFNVIAHRNWAKGLMAIMVASKENPTNTAGFVPIESVSLEAKDNHFEGDTRIFARNVQNATYNCCNNYIKSDYELCLLVEQAQYQSVTFCNNVVARNIINPSRNKIAIYFTQGTPYQRCLFVATDNTFRYGSGTDIADTNKEFIYFPQANDTFCLYDTGNIVEIIENVDLNKNM